MRILFIAHFFDPEPGAVRGLPLARELVRRGHEVEVLTGFPNYPGGKIYEGYRQSWRQVEMMDGVRVLRVPLYPSHDSNALRRIINYTSFAATASTIGLVTAKPADVAYVYHPPPTVGLSAAFFRWLRGVPFVYHIADMWPESMVESGMLGGGFKRQAAETVIGGWCKFVYRQAHSISVLSPGFKRLLIERGVPADKVHVIYNWVDEDVFRPLEPNPALLAEWGLQDTFNVLYAGNIGPFQAIDTLVRAAKLVEDLPQVRVIIAGTGPREEQVRQLARDLGTRNVIFTGRRQYWEMPLFNAAAHLQVVHLQDLPFFSATIPSKTQVSLACGRPVLMAVRGDAADVIREAEAGPFCEPENPSAMARCIRDQYNTGPAERHASGERARRYYADRMSLKHGASLTESLLLAAAGYRAADGAAATA